MDRAASALERPSLVQAAAVRRLRRLLHNQPRLESHVGVLERALRQLLDVSLQSPVVLQVQIGQGGRRERQRVQHGPADGRGLEGGEQQGGAPDLQAAQLSAAVALQADQGRQAQRDGAHASQVQAEVPQTCASSRDDALVMFRRRLLQPVPAEITH